MNKSAYSLTLRYRFAGHQDLLHETIFSACIVALGLGSLSSKAPTTLILPSCLGVRAVTGQTDIVFGGRPTHNYWKAPTPRQSIYHNP